MGIKDFIFFRIFYPLFKRQIDCVVDSYRLGQVHSVEYDKGLVYVRVTKNYPVDSEVTIYNTLEPIYDPEIGYLGTVEDVYAYGKVIENQYQFSKIILTKQKKEVKPALLVKSSNNKEFILLQGEIVSG